MASLADKIEEKIRARPSLADKIKEKIRASPQYSPNCCIYRVPPLLRQTNEQAYTPAVVSIGPLHHKDERLLPMEPHKVTFLRSFLWDSSANAVLDSYLRIVRDMEANIRACYAVPIHLSSEDFIQMVLIDSAFIIQYFRIKFRPSLVESYNNYLKICERYLPSGVERDIKLEENQLPFFVLVKLYRTAFKPDENQAQIRSFTHFACNFLGVKTNEIDPETNEAKCCHLLDLMRSYYKPTADPTCSTTTSLHAANCCHLLPNWLRNDYKPTTDHPCNFRGSPVSPTATSLYAASVKFKVIPIGSNSSNLLDIRFDKKKGILKIPKLRVDDNTEYWFRNIIAFEQCHHKGKDMYFTNYLYFLDSLVDTPEDVQLLAKEDIIENWLGSHKQVSNLINSLGDNIDLLSDYDRYRIITQQLIRHSDKTWNKNRAMLMQKYFEHPWAAISVIYAAILLLLTLVQVVAGILAIPHVLKGP